jgi:hypothetical protein
MRLSRLVRAVAAILAFLVVCGAASAQSRWQQPASDLAAQIAAILGHNTARLMIRNLSSLPVDEIPVIRKDLEADLRAHGVAANSAPNDIIVRVTLSESARGFTWVAEVIQGNETQIAVVDLPVNQKSQPPAPAQFMLRREALIVSSEPVLGAIDPPGLMILLTPSGIVVNVRTPAWTVLRTTPIPAPLPLARDPRGMILPAPQGAAFDAWLAGSRCSGSTAQATTTELTIDCHASDDPWPLPSAAETPTSSLADSAPNPAPNPPPPARTAPEASQLRASYNAKRDYFTGVVSPGIGVDLPQFYSAAVLQRATGTALLIGGIDGKVLLASNGKQVTVSGTSDWGSDFALFKSGCGDGAQIVVSGVGDSNTDSLRAYQVSGTQATPISTLLTIDGTVTALWSAPDGKSVFAVIRNPQNQYEVDRVTALCN